MLHTSNLLSWDFPDETELILVSYGKMKYSYTA